jgi:hypothetical protein
MSSSSACTIHVGGSSVACTKQTEARAALRATRTRHTKKASSSELKSISRVIVAGCGTLLHLSRFGVRQLRTTCNY